MRLLVRTGTRLWTTDEGATMAEYAVLLGLISAGTLAVGQILGDAITAFFFTTADTIGNAK
jgi:Flp pilus assembly pilin Flp